MHKKIALVAILLLASLGTDATLHAQSFTGTVADPVIFGQAAGMPLPTTLYLHESCPVMPAPYATFNCPASACQVIFNTVGAGVPGSLRLDVGIPKVLPLNPPGTLDGPVACSVFVPGSRWNLTATQLDDSDAFGVFWRADSVSHHP